MIKKKTKLSIFYCLTMIMYTIGDGFFGFGFIAFMYSKGLSLSEIGVLTGIVNLLLAFFDYPSGNISDKYGRKKTAAFGFVLFGTGLIIFGLSSSFILFLFSGLIRALGIALISGSPISWYLDELNKINDFMFKDKALPVIRTIGFLIGSLSGILAGQLSTVYTSLPSFVGGIILIIMGILLFALFEDNYGKSQNLNLNISIIENTKNFLKDKNMNLVAAYELFNSVTFTIFILAWQVYATEVIGLDYKFLGIMYSIVLLCMTTSSLLTRGFVSKLNAELITFIGIFITAIGLALILFDTNKLIFIIAFVIFEIGIGLANVSYSLWIHDYIKSEVRTSYLSGLSTVQSLIAFFIALLFGVLIERLGYTGGWIVAIVSQVFCLLIIIKFYFKNPKRQIISNKGQSNG